MSSKPSGRVVKPFYWPPQLVLRQGLAAFYFGWLTRWRNLPRWLLKASKTLPTAAGATGMGCIGFPIHPVWEVTAACNLRCRHCHADGGPAAEGELSTEESLRLIDQVAAIEEFRMLVFTGGEPLVRPDILELSRYAGNLGLTVSIATNATLLTPALARQLKEAGVVNIAAGIDGATPETHDFVRGKGCFGRTLKGIEAARAAGLDLQLNITVMRPNYDEVPRLLDLADDLDAQIVLLYHLVPAGRGGEEGLEVTREQYAELMRFVKQRQRSGRPVIEPTCAPQYFPYILGANGHRPGRLAEMAFQGCVAGSGLCYIKANGDVWPCPFIPVSAGNVREASLAEMWREGEVFRKLRHREEHLKGSCGQCPQNRVCGGCRGRAYSHYGDYLAEDPLCFLSHSNSVYEHPESP